MLLCECVRVYCFFAVLPVYVLLCAAYGVIKNDDDDDDSGGNGVDHINKIQLRRALLVLGLVTTFGGFTVPVFIQATQYHSAWPSLRGMCNRNILGNSLV